MNSSGAIAFQGTTSGNAFWGDYVASVGGSLTAVAVDGQATPLGGTYSVAIGNVQMLNDGRVYISGDLPDGTTDYGEFLWSTGGTSTLMNTADTLPAGSRVVLAERGFGYATAGDYVSFVANRAGGRSSVLVHQIADGTTTLLATEGDTVPAVGGRLRLTVSAAVYVGANGQVAFQATPVGGSSHGRSAVLVGSAIGGFSKIAVDGDLDSAGRVLGTPKASAATTPFPINGVGQVVFNAAVNGGLRGIYVGSAGDAPVRLAFAGDVIAGAALTGNVTSVASINASGQVVFLATTAAGSNLLIGTAGSTPVKIARVGDLSPGGGTFASFATPSLNSSGEVAFVATVSGGPNGIFVYSPTPSPALIALVLDGAPSPAGGNFSITAARPDVVINDQHDVFFRSTLTGGASNSGLFIRRGAAGAIQVLVLQGQAAPGTGGTFATFVSTINNLLNESYMLGSTGDVAFQSSYSLGGLTLFGHWHVKVDGTIEPISVLGQALPSLNGETAVSGAQIAEWASNGRYVLYVGASGGPVAGAIFVFTSPVASTTAVGSTVVTTPTDSTTQTTPVTLTFDQVVQGGATTLTTESDGPDLPAGFASGTPHIVYSLETTAVFSGLVNVCINYTGTTFPGGAVLKVLQYVGGVWQDVTFSGPSGGIICARVSVLSMFTVARVVPEPEALLADLSQAAPDLDDERIALRRRP
jgi:hypothetical protein